MRILGPLVCATTSAVTLTLASASASCVTVSPSTRRIGDRATSAPAAASSFSTSITSPSATLYCLPPVLTMAYIGESLLPTVLQRKDSPPTGRPSSRLRDGRYLRQNAYPPDDAVPVGGPAGREAARRRRGRRAGSGSAIAVSSVGSVVGSGVGSAVGSGVGAGAGSDVDSGV